VNLERKLPEEDKTKIEACSEQLKKSLETEDLDAIKSDLEALTQASHKMAELLYSQQAEQQTATAEQGNEDSQDGDEKSDKDDEDIVDADFEEVKK
jgi:molecular chaperone DnaK